MAELISLVEIERKRGVFLETKNRNLIAQLESADKRGGEAVGVAAELRVSLAKKDDETIRARNELIAAEAHMADAESRVSVLLEQTTRAVEDSEKAQGRLVAEKLSLEDELEKLKIKVLTVESSLMADWDSDRIEQSHLRERLNDIAADVGRLVYAIEEGAFVTADGEETLLARVQKFAEDGLGREAAPLRSAPDGRRAAGPVADRMAALRELQERG